MMKSVLVDLNDRWRVVNDPLQWIVEYRDGKLWRAVFFPTTRPVLLRDIGEKGIDATTEALEYIATWPEKHHAYGKSGSVPPFSHPTQAQVAPGRHPPTPEGADRAVGVV